MLGVEDFARGDVVREHFRLSDGADVRGNVLRLLGDVGDGERGHARERLRRVRGFLQALQLFRLGDHLLEFLGGEPLAVLRDPGLLRVLLRLGHLLVRVELDRDLVLVLDQELLDEGREDVLLRHPLLELRERLLEAQRHHRVALVEPRAERAEHEREPAREPPGVVLPHRELDRVHAGVDRGLGEPLRSDLRDGVLDELLHLGDVLLGDALEADRERGLPELVLEAPPDDGLAQPGLLERHPERRRGRAHEEVIEEPDRERRLLVERPVVEEPVDLHERLLLLVALARDVRRDHALGLVEERLRHDRGVHLAALELGEERVEDLQALLDVVVAVEPHARVARMVKLSVELLELLEAQIRDHRRVAAGIDAVRVVREQRLLRLARQDAVRAAVHTLHLVEDDALERHLALRLVELVVPSLLEERLLVLHAPRVEHRVQVDVDEVLEVLEVARRDGVARAVRVGHGVEEGVERALDELHEGLLDRVLARSAQHGVLEDVRDARAVRRGGAERHAERLVLVVI
jgi:hypothetical protein